MADSSYDWYAIDKSEWGKRPDSEIANKLGVQKNVIIYWRHKFDIPSYKQQFKRERDRNFARGLHWCSRCESYLPLDEFDKCKPKTYGLKTWCKTCRKDYRKENSATLAQRKRQYYLDNHEEICRKNRHRRRKNRQKINAQNKGRMVKLKQKFVELAGQKCQRCGYDEFNSGLEFHHIDPESKDSTPTKVIYSGDFDAAYSELDKCALLCRNCHQAFHADEWDATFTKRDGLGWTM